MSLISEVAGQICEVPGPNFEVPGLSPCATHLNVTPCVQLTCIVLKMLHVIKIVFCSAINSQQYLRHSDSLCCIMGNSMVSDVHVRHFEIVPNQWE